MKKLFPTLAFVLLAASCVQKDPGTCTLSIETPQGTRSWKVEEAITPHQRQQGLMFRTALAERSGMVFLFEPAQIVGMWMKNTKIPLDMVFIGANRKIAYIHHRARPESMDAIEPEGKMVAVLEIGGGEAKKAGLSVGNKVNLADCDGK